MSGVWGRSVLEQASECYVEAQLWKVRLTNIVVDPELGAVAGKHMVKASVGLFAFVQDERALNSEGIPDARARALGLCWTGIGAQVRNEHYLGAKILGPNPDPGSLPVEGIVPIIGRMAESPPLKKRQPKSSSATGGRSLERAAPRAMRVLKGSRVPGGWTGR